MTCCSPSSPHLPPPGKPRAIPSSLDPRLNHRSIAVAALDSAGSKTPPPRSAAGLGLCTRYDGNILGGTLLGAGMALSAACPGVTFAQAGLGLRSAQYAIQGALAGGVVYTGLLAPAIASRRKALALDTSPATVQGTLGVSRAAALVGMEALYGAVIASAILYAPRSPFSPLVAPAVGGLLIGGTQLLSLLLRGSLIGVSTAFEDAGKYATWLAGGADTKAFPKSYTSLLFAGAMAAGAYALGLAYPGVVPLEDPRVTAVNAVAGGFLFAVGSRIAGGCTSGHGISGISLLSVSSFLTIASTFAGGAAAALWAY